MTIPIIRAQQKQNEKFYDLSVKLKIVVLLRVAPALCNDNEYNIYLSFFYVQY